MWGIYLRVSDEDAQRPELSIPAQRQAIMETLIKPSGEGVWGEYTDLITGRSVSKRQQFQQMLVDAKAGLFNKLAIHKWDRFGRNLLEALQTEEVLTEAGVQVIAADMAGLDTTTAAGWMSKISLQMVAEFLSRNLGEEALKGMREKFRRGGWPWRAPDGYINKREGERGGRAWVELDPERAPLIATIFRRWATGRYDSLRELAEELNSEGYRRPDGGLWDKQTLARRLRNPFYKGTIRSRQWAMTNQGTHEPLVDEETWSCCQLILDQHGAGRTRQRKHTYILGGILWWGDDETGCRFRGTTNRGNRGKGKWIRYYRTHRQIGERRLYLRCEMVDSQIPTLLRLLEVPPDVEAALRQTYAETLEREAQREGPTERWERQVRKLEQERRNLLRLALKGAVPDDLYVEEMNRLEAALTHAQAQLEVSRRAVYHAMNALDKALLLLRQAADLWEVATNEERKKLVGLIFQRIRVDNEGTIIEAVLHQPFGWIQKTTADGGSSIKDKLSTPNATLIELSSTSLLLPQEHESIHLLDDLAPLVR